MNRMASSTIVHVLASAWQQQRNGRTPLKFWTTLALLLLAPLGMVAWSEWKIAHRTVVIYPQADRMLVAAMHHNALVASATLVAFLLLAGWITLVNNVLEQNRPALARLVPGHVARLRSGLLAAWGLLILVAAAGPGRVLDAPLEWACAVAVASTLFALAQRWPVIWLLAVASPVVLGLATVGHGSTGAWAVLSTLWRRNDWLVTAIVVAAGVPCVAAILREEGRRAGFYETGLALGRRFVASSQPGCGSLFNRSSSAYTWWMARLLARRDSAAASRLLLGFGPAVLWTTRLRDVALFTAVFASVCALVVALAAYLGRGFEGVFPWLAFGLLNGTCTPALQTAARLYRTRNEQALLVLLPGVARGASLNRWLAWQMSALYVLSALWGFALVGALAAFAEALGMNLGSGSDGGIVTAMAVALLPQVVWQWRGLARLRGAAGKESLPALAPFMLGAAVLALHAWAGVEYLAMGVAFTAAALAYCAWRWWRMGSEPTALPVGRLAR